MDFDIKYREFDMQVGSVSTIFEFVVIFYLLTGHLVGRGKWILLAKVPSIVCFSDFKRSDVG